MSVHCSVFLGTLLVYHPDLNTSLGNNVNATNKCLKNMKITINIITISVVLLIIIITVIMIITFCAVKARERYRTHTTITAGSNVMHTHTAVLTGVGSARVRNYKADKTTHKSKNFSRTLFCKQQTDVHAIFNMDQKGEKENLVSKGSPDP